MFISTYFFLKKYKANPVHVRLPTLDLKYQGPLNNWITNDTIDVMIGEWQKIFGAFGWSVYGFGCFLASFCWRTELMVDIELDGNHWKLWQHLNVFHSHPQWKAFGVQARCWCVFQCFFLNQIPDLRLRGCRSQHACCHGAGERPWRGRDHV